MKKAKVILSALLIVAMAVCLTACGDSKLVGTWGIDEDWFLSLFGASKEELKAEGVEDISSLITITFKKDGTGMLKTSELLAGTAQSDEFTWVEKDGQLSMTHDGDTITSNYTIKNGTLTLQNENETLVFKKK